MLVYLPLLFVSCYNLCSIFGLCSFFKWGIYTTIVLSCPIKATMHAILKYCNNELVVNSAPFLSIFKAIKSLL
ncbi:hypothetical protein AG1IA_09575 [Rhizoctonia solani AG-1 IA]|uniref:Uncharacterized protein n=1 Tax=Thanatephorus cucumeris (strain AG1-IA) TaxID=983506 RepID=L8WEM1_THACA|nr:hypothetical protein AG1IA_09575 [Rhizoctonia solani AG-1 IA]